MRRRSLTFALLAGSIGLTRCAWAQTVQLSPVRVYRNDLNLTPVPSPLNLGTLSADQLRSLFERQSRSALQPANTNTADAFARCSAAFNTSVQRAERQLSKLKQDLRGTTALQAQIQQMVAILNLLVVAGVIVFGTIAIVPTASAALGLPVTAITLVLSTVSFALSIAEFAIQIFSDHAADGFVDFTISVRSFGQDLLIVATDRLASASDALAFERVSTLITAPIGLYFALNSVFDANERLQKITQAVPDLESHIAMLKSKGSDCFRDRSEFQSKQQLQIQSLLGTSRLLSNSQSSPPLPLIETNASSLASSFLSPPKQKMVLP